MNASPKLSVETATQLAVFLANRPGALARVCEALAKAEINIYALATSDTVDHTVVRMVVSDPTKHLCSLAKRACWRLKLKYSASRRRASLACWAKSPSASQKPT